ncbi:MAG: RagB/SusD family nutrient uptake outer membrane protein [Bacteroidota bacterium]|nr:MAG: RagB/SusD family nutrient uptake outer membrane protein [Bacteroidota bacterium]
MKMNYLKYNQLFLVVLLSLFVSCEDFLEKTPQGNLTQETFPVSASDALLAVNACYAQLRAGDFNSGLFPLTDIMSDDAYKGSNEGDQATTIGPYNTFTFTTTSDQLKNWWPALYKGVKTTNVVLEKVPAISMDEGLKSRYLGEASFLRALFYFDLVRAWGGVPLITGLNPPLELARASKAEIYNQIKTDLRFSIAHLTEKSELGTKDLGRATTGAAKALLAKVFLFEGNFDSCEYYALQVIESTEYGLEPLFTDASSINGEHGIESVFEVGAQGVEAATGNSFANVQGVRGNPNRGWGFNRPSLDLRALFETGDPRLKGTIIDLGDVLDGITIAGDGDTPDITEDSEGNVIEIECYNRKVWTPGTTVPPQFGHNRRIIRYADVLLMAAEALNENDKPAQALIYLNLVRERAREGNNSILPDVNTTDKNQLRDAILLERRMELALEGHRFWDLVRTGKAAEVLGPLGFVTGKHELFPIPQNEIDLSQGALTQNPNW